MSEILNILSDLVKPGSAILGLIIVIQFLHKVLDSNRVYKIKQLELLHTCMKDLDNIGSAYTIEKLLERTYKVHISYEQAMVMMSHPQRQKLFALYKASHKYLEFDDEKFSITSKYASKKARCLEKFKRQTINAIKYYVSALLGGVLLVVAFKLFFTSGLLTVQFGTYNIIWFIGAATISILLLILAIDSLVDPTNITQAKEFQEHFDKGKVSKKVVWMY
ncbi:TPA: hypothetical protein RQK97_004194 [Vibrio vulnificus]|nr:hypothetical protein [Vibrio vulnificus]